MRTYPAPEAARARSSQRVAGDSLRVVCFSTYVGAGAEQTPRHLDARNFLLALRGEQVRGESVIPVGDGTRVLTPANANDSIDWFGEMVLHYLESNDIYPPFALVPVPTSKTTLESSAGPWTSLLAISIASSGLEDADLWDVLRWKRPLAPPGERTQTVAELYDNLAVTTRLQPGMPAVLVDYLFTSSATLCACAARLGEKGMPVLLALCAGRTATRATHSPFTVVAAELEGFRPGH